MNNLDQPIRNAYIITFIKETRVEHIVLKFQSLIDDIQFKFLAPSGQHVWNKLSVSTQVTPMLKTR
ncbi:hypothetical protein PR202_gb20710 [Eleusine coracana subsp. coracana]|uniref:Uncharacterized protein n=1 Tax=Eleusine coracana subsp. coracana TaxID=191504 RepID=A0AAV5FD98_ELECO|nr:hypothetical protein PR202_gb20710 [Eleusine coracana subsp. coracana]